MKINFVCDYLRWKKYFRIKFLGGIEQVFYNLKNWLEEEGHTVKINSTSNDFDVIHIQSIFALNYLLGRKYKAPKIIHAHSSPDEMAGSLIFSEYMKPVFRRYLKFYYMLGDRLITISKCAKKSLKKLGVKRHIDVVYNAVDPTVFKQRKSDGKRFRRNLGVKDGETLVLGVGSLFKRKGILDFVSVAKNLKSMKFVWVGTEMPLQIAGFSLKALRRASPNLIFTGYYKDIIDGYSGADIFFCPSYAENFGLTLVEAGMCKLPIVARDIPVFRETMGKNIFYGKTVKSFSQKIKKLAENKNIRASMSKKAYKRAMRYTPKNAVKNIVRIYNDTISRHKK